MITQSVLSIWTKPEVNRKNTLSNLKLVMNENNYIEWNSIYVIAKPSEKYGLWTNSCITQHGINISLSEIITNYFEIYFIVIVTQVCGSRLWFGVKWIKTHIPQNMHTFLGLCFVLILSIWLPLSLTNPLRIWVLCTCVRPQLSASMCIHLGIRCSGWQCTSLGILLMFLCSLVESA